jgi:hypothetical protein
MSKALNEDSAFIVRNSVLSQKELISTDKDTPSASIGNTPLHNNRFKYSHTKKISQISKV